MEKNNNEHHYAGVKEANEELEHLKWNWSFNKCCSGDFEIPENILDIEGVEYLLKLNVFNEVPQVLMIIGAKLFDYMQISKASEYSKEKYEEYVEKGTEIIERLLTLYRELGVDLKAKNNISSDWLFISSKWYIRELAINIGKFDEYKMELE